MPGEENRAEALLHRVAVTDAVVAGRQGAAGLVTCAGLPPLHL
jgi:hypothetical protein